MTKTQHTLAEVKEHKDLWNYGHPQYKKVTSWIVKMIAIDSQPFSIVEDIGFLQLLNNVCHFMLFHHASILLKR